MTGVIIVTGAAGQLGAAVVARLIAADCKVAGVDLAEAADLPGDAVFIGGVDLTDAEAVAVAYAGIVREHGPVAGLANIAGGFVWETLADGSADSFDRMYRMNVATTANSCRAALPLMDTDGAIVNVGAVGAVKAAAGMAAYAAAKAGVMRLTEALAEECKKGGPRVNAVSPSIIDTPVNRKDMPDADFDSWVSPDAVAEVVAFLLSAAARGMTGALVPVTGRV